MCLIKLYLCLLTPISDWLHIYEFVMFLHFGLPKCDPTFPKLLTLEKTLYLIICSLQQYKLTNNFLTYNISTKTKYALQSAQLHVFLPVWPPLMWDIMNFSFESSCLHWFFIKLFGDISCYIIMFSFPCLLIFTLALKFLSYVCNLYSKNFAWSPKSVQVSPVVDWRSRF